MQQKEASKLPDTQKWNQMSSAVQPIAISDIKLEPSCAQKGATKVDDNEAFQIESGNCSLVIIIHNHKYNDAYKCAHNDVQLYI